MAERLFGLETEYAFALLNRQGQRLPQPQAIEWLLDAACRRLIHLPDVHSSGLFLANGARLYIDCGQHPEFAGPEVANPWDAVRYIKAGEQILLGLGNELTQTQQMIGQVLFFRQNVDYATGSTWGSHESYLHNTDPALFRQHLLPHLVSRIIYTGAGGFEARHPGIRFTLSPRVPFLTADVSSESTHSRGVLHTRNESLSANGYHRLHLLCSESLFSEWANFLRVGPTALVVAMIEGGLRPGDQVSLSHPLEAMRVFAADPLCQKTVPAVRSGTMTAIAIQRRYLALAEAHLNASFMPPWAGETCRQWRRVLDILATGSPQSVATSLDWSIRYGVFGQFLKEQGYTWDEVGRWNEVAQSMAKRLTDNRLPPDLAELGMDWDGGEPWDSLLEELAPQLCEGASIGDWRKFRALRSRILELDARFGQLGSLGIFSQLDRAGVLHQHFPGVDNFEHAMECPPALGRAKLRGEYVRRLGGKDNSRNGYVCDWAAIWDQSQRRFLDLADPFTREADWKAVAPSAVPGGVGRHRQIMELLRGTRGR